MNNGIKKRRKSSDISAPKTAAKTKEGDIARSCFLGTNLIVSTLDYNPGFFNVQELGSIMAVCQDLKEHARQDYVWHHLAPSEGLRDNAYFYLKLFHMLKVTVGVTVRETVDKVFGKAFKSLGC